MEKGYRFPIILLVCMVWVGASFACGNATPTIEPTKISTATLELRVTQPPAATSAMAVLNTATAWEEQTMPSARQEELKDEWRFAYTSGIILFNSCRMIFETHLNFQQGEIDIEEARSELSIEADTITLVNVQIVNELPSEDTGDFIWELETDMRVLIEFWSQMNTGDIGASEITDPLMETCLSLDETTAAVANAAMEQGMTETSFHELESEIEDVIDELVKGVMD